MDYSSILQRLYNIYRKGIAYEKHCVCIGERWCWQDTFYRVEGATVYVDAIYHQLQDYENIFVNELNR